jgi:hypothetical protein
VETPSLKFGDLNVSDFVVIVNFLLCSGAELLIKESEHLRKLRVILTHGSILIF